MTDLNSVKQQADDNLTWLARNVHEWPATTLDAKRQGSLFWIEPERNNIKAVIDSNQFSVFTKDQWLTRRAELQNKPDWGEVESDAEWMAQHPNGRWAFFNREPFASSGNGGGWKFDGFYAWLSQNVGEVLGDWRDTLERRPQAAKSNPNPEPSSDDWHKRGELPPVGTVCLYAISDRRSCEVEITAHAKLGICFVEIGKFGENYVSKTAELHRFRPIPTERERVAAELVDVMMAVPVSDRKTASESFMSMALAIYDHLHPENKS